ncbi:MAG: M20/M25/M40 family metallo-hydrolase [Oscillospiraceae bacterium]|nr:M20/M25/M40 family metallo-hydrolase [Oscillospiraceae bacterium]
MIGSLILAVVAAFFAVIFIRTLCFTPKETPSTSIEAVSFDQDAAIDALARLIRCKTISRSDPGLEDNAEFEKLIGLLPGLYPNVFKTCCFQQLPDRGLLFKWPGKTGGNPTVLMAHYDVVPANEEAWEKPPFDGIIEDGHLWGRGTLDTKATFNGILFAANTLIAQGFQPERDVYFAFSGGEEVAGKGGPNIVDWFAENKITPALVLDEGGAVVEKIFPGVKKPCGLIGIAEKGFMNVQFKNRSPGGHASSPKPHTPVGILSRACARIESHPFKAHMEGPAARMFDTLGRHSTFLYRLIFANLWCFGWIIDLMGKRSGGEMNALLRTTVAFTQMQGSPARNVIPPEATMVANMRLNPADSVQSTLEYLRRTVKDNTVEITCLESMEPSRVSIAEGPAWDKLTQAVREVWPDSIVSPYLMIACSDARHWGRISDKVFRFSAMDLTSQERASIHGNNEKIRLECIARAVEFYIRLITKC